MAFARVGGNGLVRGRERGKGGIGVGVSGCGNCNCSSAHNSYQMTILKSFYFVASHCAGPGGAGGLDEGQGQWLKPGVRHSEAGPKYLK